VAVPAAPVAPALLKPPSPGATPDGPDDLIDWWQMRTFYALHVHRKDGSWRHHIMRGEVPKVGDTVPATLAGEKVSPKVGVVNDLERDVRDRSRVIIEVDADEV